MITRVKQLTGMNIQALKEAKLGMCGATYVEFDLSPGEALRQLDSTMSGLAGTSRQYRSLSAVRRKLTAATREWRARVPATSPVGVYKLTSYVTVAKEAGDK
jgi:hypothetical protein